MSATMSPHARSAYLQASVSTSGAERLLVMLVQRLELDVRRALEAQQSGDHPAAHNHLVHAQDIVAELRSTLDVDAWVGAAGLGAIYDWLLVRLVIANVDRNAEVTAECLSLVEDLVATWSEATAVAAGLAG